MYTCIYIYRESSVFLARCLFFSNWMSIFGLINSTCIVQEFLQPAILSWIHTVLDCGMG